MPRVGLEVIHQPGHTLSSLSKTVLATANSYFRMREPEDFEAHAFIYKFCLYALLALTSIFMTASLVLLCVGQFEMGLFIGTLIFLTGGSFAHIEEKLKRAKLQRLKAQYFFSRLSDANYEIRYASTPLYGLIELNLALKLIDEDKCSPARVDLLQWIRQCAHQLICELRQKEPRQELGVDSHQMIMQVAHLSTLTQRLHDARANS